MGKLSTFMDIRINLTSPEEQRSQSVITTKESFAFYRHCRIKTQDIFIKTQQISLYVLRADI